MALGAAQHFSKAQAMQPCDYEARLLFNAAQFQENICLVNIDSNDDCEACLGIIMPMQAQAIQLCKATVQA